jgi:hypothetical protein
VAIVDQMDRFRTSCSPRIHRFNELNKPMRANRTGRREQILRYRCCNSSAASGHCLRLSIGCSAPFAQVPTPQYGQHESTAPETIPSTSHQGYTVYMLIAGGSMNKRHALSQQNRTRSNVKDHASSNWLVNRLLHVTHMALNLT